VPYYESEGFSKEFATLLIVILNIVSLISTIPGGVIGDHIWKRNPPALVIFGSCLMLLSLIFVYLILQHAQAGKDKICIVILAVVLGILIGIPSGYLLTISLHINNQNHHGFIFGLSSIIGSIGLGIGPWLGGIWIPKYGYWPTMLLAIWLWILSTILYAMIAVTIRQDLKRM